MSVLADVLDRLSDITTLRAQVTELIGQQRDMRGIMLSQQKELAELRGQLKALIQMQAAMGKKSQRAGITLPALLSPNPAGPAPRTFDRPRTWWARRTRHARWLRR